MVHTIPQVHLCIAMDPGLAPGPILQSLDYLRAKQWQQETILVCDESWRPYLHADQTVLFLNKNDFYLDSTANGNQVNMPYLDQFLEQLDSFEIIAVTQFGSLSWGRWIEAYLDENNEHQFLKIEGDTDLADPIGLINRVASSLELDLSSPLTDKVRSGDIFIDPYEGEELSSKFLTLAQGSSPTLWPEWLCVISKPEDAHRLGDICGEDSVIDAEDVAGSSFNQSILCFSDHSKFAVTSRSYSVALFGTTSVQSLFFQGDISVQTDEDIHLSELINILGYWKAGRLKELAFQWYNLGIEIEAVEFFHDRLVRRNLQTYSSDLFNCQQLVAHFSSGESAKSNYEVHRMIDHLRGQVTNDPFSLSFSLKMLVMITERMLASAACGERLFHRLGSDFHRIIIGESLIEGVLAQQQRTSTAVDVKKNLSAFLKYLVQVDFINDQSEITLRAKES